MSGAAHPVAETLARYARGELPRAASRELERHLMSCLECQQEVDRLSAGAGTVRWQGHRFRRAEKPPNPADPEKAERRQELAETLQALGDIIGIVGETELEALLRLPEHQRRARLRDDERLRHLHLCELLEARCRAAWIEAPAEAVELARMAVLLADRLDPETYGSKRLQGFRTVAWLHLGNAFRIAAEAVGPPGEPAPAEPEDEEADPGIRPRAFLVREATHLAEAEDALRETRDAFLEHRMGFDAALATLELAMLYEEQERAGDLKQLAGEAVPLFESHGAAAYTVDAMRFLRDRLESEGVDLDLLETLHTFLQRRRNDPQLQPE
ncbi:MAG TPA: zf-HC2 domain-containing protein [Thermoanaerobaculia bacterium]|nr:zf-HC2 domain-containing protein [Thermoanaerobaculia bacterium]